MRISKRAIKVPHLEQQKNYTCGAAALRQILALYKIKADENDLAKQLKTNKKGTNPYQIVEVAKSYGIKAVLMENMSLKSLKDFVNDEVPIMVMIQSPENNKDMSTTWNSGHYAVVSDVNSKITLVDPGTKKKTLSLSKENFMERWHDTDLKGNKLTHAGIAFYKPVKLSKRAGLLKIPPSLEKEIQDLVVSQYAAILKEKVPNTNQKIYNDAEANFMLPIKENWWYRSLILKDDYFKEINIKPSIVKLKVFIHLIPSQKGIFSAASFFPKERAIVVNLTLEFFSKRAVKDYDIMKDFIKKNLSHELRHLIQTIAHPGLPKRNIRKHPTPTTDIDELHSLNDQEFHAKIADAVFEFLSDTRKIPDKKPHVVNWIANSEFFNTLKLYAPLKWKNAIKLFYKEVI